MKENLLLETSNRMEKTITASLKLSKEKSEYLVVQGQFRGVGARGALASFHN